MADFKKKSSFNSKEEESVAYPNEFEEKTPPTEKKKTQNKKYKIILIAENYAVIEVNGNGQTVFGKFSDKKIGDEIEVEI
jgi:hypothetical protein